MLTVLAIPVLPILLIFGLYHLSTWFDVFHITRYNFWRRVAWISAASHALLLTGFLVFSRFDYHVNLQFGPPDSSYGNFLFERSEFWRLLAIFDTLPFAVILAVVSLLDRLSAPVPGLLAGILGIAYLLGTVQWFWMGGAVGMLLERFWNGLKNDEDADSPKNGFEEDGWPQ